MNKLNEKDYEMIVTKIQKYIFDWEFVKHSSEFTFKRIEKLVGKKMKTEKYLNKRRLNKLWHNTPKKK